MRAIRRTAKTVLKPSYLRNAALGVLPLTGAVIGIFADDFRDLAKSAYRAANHLEIAVFAFAIVLVFLLAGLLYLFANQMEKTDALRRENLALVAQLDTDSRSGLSSYEFLKRRFSDEYLPETKNGKTFAVLMIDLVDFKSINDTYGSNVGDDTISAFGGFLKGFVRSKRDMAARYGEAADEFFFIIAGDISALKGFANRLRREAAEEIDLFAGPSGERLTLDFWSSGTEIRPDDSWNKILTRLSDGMVAAKKSGKLELIVRGQQ
jgi:diguanylate cyclase (GGDEF)-like protein